MCLTSAHCNTSL